MASYNKSDDEFSGSRRWFNLMWPLFLFNGIYQRPPRNPSQHYTQPISAWNWLFPFVLMSLFSNRTNDNRN